MPLRQRIRPASTGALALVVALALLSGCGDDDEPAADSTTTVASATSSTSSAPTTSTAATTTSSGADAGPGTAPGTGAGATTTVVESDADQVPDGTSFGYLTGIDIGDRTITIDIAQLLTGDAAVKAAIEDGALEPGETSIDNDYYIRNQNPKLRTAPVGATAPVNVLSSPGSADLESGSLVDLAESLTAATGDAGPRLPVQIVASGGTVTRIDEVFFP